MTRSDEGREALPAGGILLPDDLRACLPERTLIRLALEAVQMAEWRDKSAAETPLNGEAGVPRPLMATVLVYAYAAGTFGSRDIETLAQQDSALRYLCRSNVPDWDTLRLFRRGHVQSITRCLAALLEAAWNQSHWDRFTTPFASTDHPASSISGWPLSHGGLDFGHEADCRVMRAIQADSRAMDE
jgi:hypothetical protein